MRKRKIAIIGGGQIGTILALLATQRELGDLVIIDLPQGVDAVRGKALDIAALKPHYGVDSTLTASSDYAAIEGADLVIVTAGVARKPNMSREDLLEVNLAVMGTVAENIRRYAPQAFVIASTNPVDTMTLALQRLSGLPKQQVVGLSGALDSGRFRAFLAEATGISVNDIFCTVMGGHGPTMVPLVRTATAGGIPIRELLDEATIASIVKRTQEAGTEIVNLLGNGSAYLSPAAAILEMAEAYLYDKKRLIACSALCEGEFGVNGLYLGVPCLLGAGGVERVVELALDSDELAKFAHTIAVVEKTVALAGL